jgi:hypothetical protein
MPLGGESEQSFFAFFTLVSRKHTKELGGTVKVPPS